MGIQGLIPFLKKASRPVNVKEFAGCTVAVDVYCWLHKGAFSCADKLVKGEKTDGYVYYCIKMVNVLRNANITPILVFDGCRLPAKREVERNRREQRENNRKRAKQFLREGKLKEARECFQRSIDITPQMALDVIQACRRLGIDCIVAPYEADAQLAFLNKSGIAQLVITEDSDLVMFGCDHIIFKMDSNGWGVLVNKTSLHQCVGLTEMNFTFDKFRWMGIMSGCDYLQNLPGIGLAKSCKFFNRVNNPNLNMVLNKIPVYLRMPQLTITQEYKENFVRADNTFLYQLAFDPRSRKLVPVNPYPPNIDPSSLDYAGPYPTNNQYMNDDIAYQIAIGNINVNTMETMANFDPATDLTIAKTSSWDHKSSANRTSIWSHDFRPNKASVFEDPKTVKHTPTKGKEITIKANIFSKRKRKENITPDDENARIHQSPCKKRNKTEDWLKPLSEKELLECIFSSATPEKCPGNGMVKETPEKKKPIRSQYFSNGSAGKSKPNLDWFDKIANEYETHKKSVPGTNSLNSSSSKLESSVKVDKIETTVPICEKEKEASRDSTKSPSNFVWLKKLDSYLYEKVSSQLHSTPIAKRPFKSPGPSLTNFSFNVSQNSDVNSVEAESFGLSQMTESSATSEVTSDLSSSLEDPSTSQISNDQFQREIDLTQDADEMSQTSSNSQRSFESRKFLNSTGFQWKRNKTAVKSRPSRCRQTGLNKKSKRPIDKNQMSITETLQKFCFKPAQVN